MKKLTISIVNYNGGEYLIKCLESLKRLKDELYFFLKNDRLYHLTNKDMTKPHEVDSVVGAFMLMRKSVLEKVGYFDEDYFLYGEDIDLCFRVKKEGFKVMYVPQVKIKHVKGISSGIKKHSQARSFAGESTKNL